MSPEKNRRIYQSLLIIILLNIALFAKAASARSGELRFIVMGDSRPILSVLGQSPPFKRILWETDLIAPDFAVHVGDLVFGYMSNDKELQRQYADLAKTLATVRTPMFFSMGNHEVGSRGGLEYYEKNVSKLYQSFDNQGSHFILLDSDWGETGDSGTLGAEQYEWLKADLEANKSAKHVFVFMHKPMYGQGGDNGGSWSDGKMRDDVEDLLKAAGNVRAVFEGHEHVYRTYVKDGIAHYVTGGGGAETSNPEFGGFYNYMLVTISGGDVDYRVIEPYHLWFECDPECDGKNKSVSVTIVNSLSSNMPLKVGGLVVDMPALPGGYAASGARIAATRDNHDGTISLKISALMNSPVGYKQFTLQPAGGE